MADAVAAVGFLNRPPPPAATEEENPKPEEEEEEVDGVDPDDVSLPEAEPVAEAELAADVEVRKRLDKLGLRKPEAGVEAAVGVDVTTGCPRAMAVRTAERELVVAASGGGVDGSLTEPVSFERVRERNEKRLEEVAPVVAAVLLVLVVLVVLVALAPCNSSSVMGSWRTFTQCATSFGASVAVADPPAN